MRFVKNALLAIVFLFAHANAQATDSLVKSHEFFSKGGIGIISKDLYVQTKSLKNEIRLESGKTWSGNDRSIPQVVYVISGKVIETPSTDSAFDLSNTVLVSFQTDRIYFYDFRAGSGGFYRR